MEERRPINDMWDIETGIVEDAQVIVIPGERRVSELSNIEREVLLTDLVQRVLDHKYFFDEIGADVFDCLVDAELIDFEQEDE